MKPCLLQLGDVPQAMSERFERNFEVIISTASSALHDLGDRADKIEALAFFVGTEKVSRQLLDGLANLKMISNFGVGYDGIDAAYAASKGIMVTHTPNVLNGEVASTTIMLMLAVSRRLVAFDRYVRDGRWAVEGQAPLTHGIDNARVGILGLGRIGEEIARRLAVFNCQIAYHSRQEKPGIMLRYFPSLKEMAQWSQFLIVVTPGGAATRHLVNREVIEALGAKGTLINVARGSVVDEAELVAALVDGRLGAAGLDVFENEPHVPQALFAMDNVVLQPHVGSGTVETRAAMGDLVCENLELFFAGKPVKTPVPECKGLV